MSNRESDAMLAHSESNLLANPIIWWGRTRLVPALGLAYAYNLRYTLPCG